MKYIYKLLPFYFSICIFVGTFANGPLISVPIFVCIIINFIYYYLVLTKRIKFNHKWIKLLLLYSISLSIAYLIFPHTDKSTNHFILYLFSFFFLFIGIRNSALYVVKKKPSFLEVLHKAIFIVVLITSIYTLFEFIFKNFLGIDLNDYFIQFRRKEYEYFQYGVYRTRGFLDESGHLALFFETFSLIAIAYARKYGRLKFILIISIIVFALLTTLSAFGYVCLIGTLILTPHYLLKNKTLLFKIISFTFILFIVTFVVFFIYDYLEFLYVIIDSKLDDSNSMIDRTSRFESVLPFLESPQALIGYGPGSFRLINDNGIVSLYLNVLLNTGYIGLFIYVVFLLRQYYLIKKVKDIYYHWAYSLCFIMSTVHFVFLDNFYYPFYWILLTLVHLQLFTQNGKYFNYNNNI